MRKKKGKKSKKTATIGASREEEAKSVIWYTPSTVGTKLLVT
jgi:hypothetical protein